MSTKIRRGNVVNPINCKRTFRRPTCAILERCSFWGRSHWKALHNEITCLYLGVIYFIYMFRVWGLNMLMLASGIVGSSKFKWRQHTGVPIYRNLPDNLFLLKNKRLAHWFPGTKQSGPYGPTSKLGDSRHYPINWQLSWVVTATFSIVPLKLKQLAPVFMTHLTSAAKIWLSQNIM